LAAPGEVDGEGLGDEGEGLGDVGGLLAVCTISSVIFDPAASFAPVPGLVPMTWPG
jgi:hypothetical protein